MTTYEEISTCRKRNRRFWNQECRYVIAHIREAQRIHDLGRQADCYRWLGSQLRQRAYYAYLKAGL